MKCKTKLLAFIVTLIGCVIVTSVGYSLYTIKGTTEKEVNIPVQKIETNYLENLFTYNRIMPNENIAYETNHNIIVSDVMELELTYKASLFAKYMDTYDKYGLLIKLNVQDDRLYGHLKNHICYYQDFLTIKFSNSIHECASNNVYRYYSGLLSDKKEMDCFTYDDIKKEINLMIPVDVGHEVVENTYSISSLYPSITGNPKFILSFNFHLLEEKINDYFTLDHFILNGKNLFNINISMEML